MYVKYYQPTLAPNWYKERLHEHRVNCEFITIYCNLDKRYIDDVKEKLQYFIPKKEKAK